MVTVIMCPQVVGAFNNKITFGSGDNDVVSSLNGIQGNTITFGDGAGALVQNSTPPDVFNNIITFGNGAGDSLKTNSVLDKNIISFGDGIGDSLSATWGGSNNVITFGNGDNVTITIGDLALISTNNNMITVGNGDKVAITLGGSDAISNNTITVGDGNNSTITLNAPAGGGNTIVTGTGSNVTVNAGTHTIADTFGFSLGTSGAAFTTVLGAKINDLVIASDAALGNTLVDGSVNVTQAATLREYIATLVFQETDSTAVAMSDVAGDVTFIVTLAANGQLGAMVINGEFDAVSITNHVLTLLD
jgi:hypothetical protein